MNQSIAAMTRELQQVRSFPIVVLVAQAAEWASNVRMCLEADRRSSAESLAFGLRDRKPDRVPSLFSLSIHGSNFRW
jgi:hypothetical protein